MNASLLLLPLLLSVIVPLTEGSLHSVVPKYKFQALVLREQNGVKIPFCGGSIITAKFVLSAANCFSGLPNKIHVWAGSWYLDVANEQSVVKKIINHPKYNPHTQMHDLAILELETPLKLGKEVDTIKLPPSTSYKLPPNPYLLISGFGVTDENSPEMSRELMFAEVRGTNAEDCVQYYKKRNLEIDPEAIICVPVKKDRRDGCFGDAGCPLIYNLTQVGVVSFGQGCGVPGSRSVYTNLTPAMDWIHSVINNKHNY